MSRVLCLVAFAALSFAALGVHQSTANAAECLVNFDDFGALDRYADKVQNQRTDWVAHNPRDYQQVCSNRIIRLNAQPEQDHPGWDHFHLGHEDPDMTLWADYFGEDLHLDCSCRIDNGTGYGVGFGKKPGCFAAEDPTIECQPVDHVREPRVLVVHDPPGENNHSRTIHLQRDGH